MCFGFRHRFYGVPDLAVTLTEVFLNHILPFHIMRLFSIDTTSWCFWALNVPRLILFTKYVCFWGHLSIIGEYRKYFLKIAIYRPSWINLRSTIRLVLCCLKTMCFSTGIVITGGVIYARKINK